MNREPLCVAMKSGTRWKYLNADEYALENPVSQLYKQLQLLHPMDSLLAHTSVVLHADPRQSNLLNSACFGRPLLAVPMSSSSCDEDTNRSSSLQEAIPEDGTGEALLFELGLEEAFFLCYKLRCLQVHHKGQQGQVKLNDDELWRSMLKGKQGFLQYYKAYSHLRTKNWIVRTGLQYGADFVAYRHHPAQVHSEYAVIVVPAWEERMQLSSWTHMQGMIRLCGTVAKTLLLLHIIPRSTDIDYTNPECLELFSVQEVEVKRWLPEKHREDNGISSVTPPVNEKGAES